MLLWMEYHPCLAGKHAALWSYFGHSVQLASSLFICMLFLQDNTAFSMEVLSFQLNALKFNVTVTEVARLGKKTHLDVPLQRTLKWTWKNLLPDDHSFFLWGKVIQFPVQRDPKVALYSYWLSLPERQKKGRPIALQPKRNLSCKLHICVHMAQYIWLRGHTRIL